MSVVKIKCFGCNKIFLKKLSYFNFNSKLRLKNYCSFECFSRSNIHSKEIICENKSCKKVFKRNLGELSDHNFCSRSCAISVHNGQRPKTVKICANHTCNNKFVGSNKYCSAKCIPKTLPKYSKQELLNKIQSFYFDHKRIPLKAEFNSQWQAFRRVFGTWNKAIRNAGFEANLEKFTHKFKARDGHICDSLSEKIIDDWLFGKKIDHQRNVYYPNQRKFKTDFLIKDKYWIEFLGLKGAFKKYDDLYTRKLEIAKENKIKIIELYPSDLFPKGKLSQKLSFLLK